jgi:hypothetical protein
MGTCATVVGVLTAGLVGRPRIDRCTGNVSDLGHHLFRNHDNRRHQRVGWRQSGHEEIVIAMAFAPVRDPERQRALDVLVTAFTADPVIRWLYPEAHRYLTYFPSFLMAFGGKAFSANTFGGSASFPLWRCGSRRTLSRMTMQSSL